ncbi:unnamed protein product, partial [marine sediment metagenome]
MAIADFRHSPQETTNAISGLSQSLSDIGRMGDQKRNDNIRRKMLEAAQGGGDPATIRERMMATIGAYQPEGEVPGMGDKIKNFLNPFQGPLESQRSTEYENALMDRLIQQQTTERAPSLSEMIASTYSPEDIARKKAIDTKDVPSESDKFGYEGGAAAAIGGSPQVPFMQR